MTAVTPEKIALLDILTGNAKKICIVAHTHPDGDAVGSTTALMEYLRRNRGVDATVVLPDRWPDQLDFLADGGGIVDFSADPARASSVIRDADLLFCLDFNNFSRTGELESELVAFSGKKVLIDHHLNPSEPDFDLCFSETQVSSTCELLFNILMMLPDTVGNASSLPPRSVEALMTGMTTDTNNFANSVFPGTLDMASRLLAAGADRDSIINHIYNSYRINRIKAMGYLLDRKFRTAPGGVAYMILRKDESEALDLREGETEAFVNIPLAAAEVNFSIFIREDNGYFRVSIRSRKGHSANMMARLHFNGGGHEQAAGGRLYFPRDIASPDMAEEYILTSTARFLQEYEPGTITEK